TSFLHPENPSFPWYGFSHFPWYRLKGQVPDEKTMKYHEPIDATGRKLKPGDIVRIIGVPDFSSVSEEIMQDHLQETLPIFQYLVGKYKKIVKFNEKGLAEIEFRIRKGPHAGMHWIWIESCLLRARRSKKSDLKF
ncbi:hypothetical protein JXA32_01265, partial [Candidatus Sumerlaeota bacterium]|nr:hypothetical protein [Candidatus Sumerlaeota bacterium]